MSPRFILLALFPILLTVSAQAQPAPASPEPPAHEVPFAAEGNTLRLIVANTADAPVGGVQVRLTEAPAWVTLREESVAVNGLAAGKEAVARFTFDAAEDAPIGETAALRFEVTSAAGPLAEKTVRLTAGAPEAFVLKGSYPNPFRQRATIAYDLPEAGPVRVEVYDVLGRRVAVPFEGEQAIGRQTVPFDGGRLASGVYFYRVEAGGKVETGRMTLVR